MNGNDFFIELFSRYPELFFCKEEIMNAFELLKKAYENRATVMVCGNGGSAADSEHIVGELMKGFHLKRPLSDTEKQKFEAIDGGREIADKLQGAIKAVSLVSQSGVISAFANDIDADLVFAQQVYGYASNENDVLIALSTSGNSANVVNAAKTANACGIKSIAITGENDSKLSKLCTVTVKTPTKETFRIQEYTLPIYHALCAALEAQYFN